MGGSTLVFQRDIDLPREIVWDALVDEDLVSGWLAEATIDARVGGRYHLVWLHPDPPAPTLGEIAVIDEPVRLEVATPRGGSYLFELEEIEGGSRGRSTSLRLTVVVDTEPAFTTRMKAYWLTDLDQLESLLRGHPVDWANWWRDHERAWSLHLHEVVQGSA